jgi:hypothetical protein
MEFKSFMEALKGKQHKIDKNKNGKVDAHDFELLRKEETEELEEATVKTQKYEWGTMKTVHHGSDFSIPLHPEHHQEIAKLKDQQEHKFKTEDGKHWTAKRSGDDVHFQGANGGNSTTVKHSTMSESVEELDEIRRMKTKLNKLDDVSNKSVARQKLSNLMKSGKARGALIANKMRTLNMGDDIDQEDLDALHEVMSKDAKAGDWIHDFVHSSNPKFDGKSKKERINMALGAYYDTHKKKDGISEEAEELDESVFADKEQAQSVASKLKSKFEDGNYSVVADKDKHRVVHSYHSDSRVKKDIAKLNEEQIDEKSDQAKQNKTMKNTMDASRGARYKLNNPVPDAEPEHKTAQAHNKAIGRALRNEDKMTTTKDKSGKLVSFKYEGDWKKSTEKKEGSGKAANLAGQAMQKMAKANEQAPVAPVPDRKYIKGTPENKALKDSRKPINGMPTNKIKEEKDEQEYGYEGDMALNQLATLTRCAEMIKEILKPDTDMPEWVQSKITLATDYIQTAADYMHSEMNEAKSVEVKVNAAGDAAHEEKWEAVKKVKKPVKESFDDEGNLIANKVSYKEFMLEYTPGPGGVTQIKGRSYGASYSDPEGADDYDDKKPMKPAAEKRGRGRPAGAKSGARKITGTSKLMNK